MKTIKAIICSIVLCAMLLSGCKKYLDQKSDASLVVPSTIADLQALLDDAPTINKSSPSFGMASCDDYFITDITYNSRTLRNKNVYKWQPYEYNFSNDWSYAYAAIYRANICLETLPLIPQVPNNQQSWNNIKGSALFYRAYYFLELSGEFAKAYDEQSANADMGIVLRTVSDFNVPSTRASVQQSYDAIIAGAKEAVPFLPNQVAIPTRPSKVSAFGLLARAYLSMRKYDSAGRYATLALALKDDLLDYNNTADVNPAATIPFKRFNAETIFYSTMNTSIYLHIPSAGAALVDTSLYVQYGMNDLRQKTFFANAGAYRKFKGSYSGDVNAIFSGIAVDELVLIKAEAMARAGSAQPAMDALNELLIKRFASGTFIPLTASTAPEALQIILAERRKELLYRGSIRWMDIKRLNKENAAIVLKRLIAGETFTLPPNDKRYALPIPTDIIQNTGIKQNE